MRTKIFQYKGYVGIMSDPKAEGLLNDPTQPGQLGYVVKAEFVDIDPSALKVLKNLKKNNDCIGDVDIFQSDLGPIVNWLGGNMKLIDIRVHDGSRDYDANLITKTVKVKPPKDFVDYIKRAIKEGKLK